jgi:hypothetical protein
MNQLLVAQRFYATGTFQLVIGDLFHVDQSTVCRTVSRVTEAIAALRPTYIKFPTNQSDVHLKMQQFYDNSNFPGAIGAIDCTHVPIQSPGSDNAEIYRNRKGYFSINVQLVCDAKCYITDVVARWPGSVHDSTIFDNCRLRAILESGQLEGYLIGDSGYACRSYMMTPIANPATIPEQRYNNAQALGRNCIERTNGILKRRFPCMKYGMRLRTDNTLKVIVATAILHNIATALGEDVPEEDELLVSYLHMRQQKGLQVTYDPVEVTPPVGLIAAGAAGMRRALIDGHFT